MTNTHTQISDLRWTSREVGRFDSLQDGPTLVIIGGVHGNEPAGLYAAMRVLDALNEDQPTAMRGRVVVLAGNLQALNAPGAHTRYIDSDLNRLCTAEQLALPASTSVEHAQMHELLAAIRAEHARSSSMIVIDLHTTSAESTPVVVLQDSIRARRFVEHFPMPMYLGFEEELPGLVVDRITDELGCIACVVEGGQHEDPDAVVAHEAVIWTALDAAGILPMAAMVHQQDPRAALRASSGNGAGDVFDIRYRHAISSPDFAMAPGIQWGTPVYAGKTVVAYENGEPVVATVRGRVFLPNFQSIKRIGDDGFFIVRRIGVGWLGLSARLRRQEWLHALIGHMPGVYSMDDGSLLVDAQIAAFLKRQIFHLLGYRLIRHDDRDGGRGIGRLVRGMNAFVRAFFRGAIPGGPDRDDERFWIVQRRRLDLMDP